MEEVNVTLPVPEEPLPLLSTPDSSDMLADSIASTGVSVSYTAQNGSGMFPRSFADVCRRGGNVIKLVKADVNF